MDKTLTTDGIPSITHKISIQWLNPETGKVYPAKAYFHLIWFEGKLIGIDFDGLNAQVSSSKAVLREYCRELSERLRREEIDLEYICDRWIAQRFAPEGYCDQTKGMVTSILDAASKVLRKRYLSES